MQCIVRNGVLTCFYTGTMRMFLLEESDVTVSRQQARKAFAETVQHASSTTPMPGWLLQITASTVTKSHAHFRQGSQDTAHVHPMAVRLRWPCNTGSGPHAARGTASAQRCTSHGCCTVFRVLARCWLAQAYAWGAHTLVPWRAFAQSACSCMLIYKLGSGPPGPHARLCARTQRCTYGKKRKKKCLDPLPTQPTWERELSLLLAGHS